MVKISAIFVFIYSFNLALAKKSPSPSCQRVFAQSLPVSVKLQNSTSEQIKKFFSEYIYNSDHSNLIKLKKIIAEAQIEFSTSKDLLLNAITALALEGKTDVVTKDGLSLLHLSVLENDTKSIDLLFKKGGDLEAEDSDGNTPLLLAIKYNKLEALDKLIHLGADVDTIDKHGTAPVTLAIELNHLDALDKLIQAKANLEIKNTYGDTPLITALYATSYYGDPRASLRLIKAGVNTETPNRFNKRPIWIAISSDAPESIVLSLLKNKNLKTHIVDKDDNNLFHLLAISNGYSQKVVDYLIRRKVDINSVDRLGHSPIYKLVYLMYKRVIPINAKTKRLFKSFLLAGARANYAPVFLRSASELYSKEGQYLSDFDRHILYFAILMGDQYIIDHLLQHGADVNFQTPQRVGWLHLIAQFSGTYSIENGDKTVSLLAKHKINIDASEEEFFNTPLHIATRYNNLPIMKALLENGADPYTINRLGYSPINIAGKYGLNQALQLLLQFTENYRR